MKRMHQPHPNMFAHIAMAGPFFLLDPSNMVSARVESDFNSKLNKIQHVVACLIPAQLCKYCIRYHHTTSGLWPVFNEPRVASTDFVLQSSGKHNSWAHSWKHSVHVLLTCTDDIAVEVHCCVLTQLTIKAMATTSFKGATYWF